MIENDTEALMVCKHLAEQILWLLKDRRQRGDGAYGNRNVTQIEEAAQRIVDAANYQNVR